MARTEPAPPGAAVAAPGGHALVTRKFSPQQSAVALTYSKEEAAPRVVAKGRGLVAQAIIERAHQHGVYGHESKELVSLLMQVDLDQRIPPALYRAVAELLVWVYRLEQQGLAGSSTNAADDLARLEKSAPGLL